MKGLCQGVKLPVFESQLKEFDSFFLCDDLSVLDQGLCYISFS